MNIVLFGAARLASLAWFALTNDSSHQVVGFTVDRPFLTEPQKDGLPVAAFDELETHFPPDQTAFMAPLGLATTRGLATERRAAANKSGYPSLSHVSSRSTVSPDLAIGTNCMIFDGVVIEPFVRIGDDVVIRAGCLLSHDVAIAGSCFFAPRVTLGGGVEIGERCFLGVGATVQPNVRVAPGCFIAAGARVTRDTEEDGVYDGAPAVRRAIPPSRLKRVVAHSAV